MKKIAIAVAIVAAVGVGGVTYANSVATKKARIVLDNQLVVMGADSDATFTYADVSASVISKSLTISDMNVISDEGEKIVNIASVVVKGYDPDKIAPRSSIDIQGLKLSKELVAQMPEEMNSMLALASYDFHSALDYDEKSGHSDVVFNVVAQDLVSFDLAMGLANSTPLVNASYAAQQQASEKALSEEELMQQQLVIMQAMEQLEPRSINMTLNNQGKLKALVESELSKNGMNVEQMQMMVEQELQQAPVNPDIAKEIIRFVKGLNSLSISAKLPEGKTMEQITEEFMMLMGEPEKIVKLINLEVKGS